MISRIKIIICLVLISGTFFSCTSCGSDDSSDNRKNVVPSLLFGANYDWIHRAFYSINDGDLLRDRSFRSMAVGEPIPFWLEIEVGGDVEFNTVDPGDTNAAGGNNYTGYVEVTRTGAGELGIAQGIMEGVTSGESYQVSFSSFGDGSAPDVEVYLYDSTFSILASSGAITVANGSWTQHSITLIPSASEDAAVLAILLTSISTDTIRIDEVRMLRSGQEPEVKPSLKTAIQDVGVTSLRWPGGTLVDWFFWKDSVGPVISRAEFEAYDYYETPALGLHEFLDLCEELNIEPMVQVNVLDTPVNAADLVEYILGSASTTQGAVRAGNGRTNPWNVRYFEIGNEPTEDYSGGSLPDTGANYASLANDVISAMKAKASSLEKTIYLGAINEPCMQFADWLVPGDNDIMDLIYNWNAQVFDGTSGVNNADFTNGHFYSSRYLDVDEEINFQFAMSGGKLLRDTIDAKIEAVTLLPFWLTEYHILIEDSSGDLQTNYLKDFQSGLVIADLFMYAISSKKVPGAYVYNLLHEGGFGILLDPEAGTLRPAGIVFKLFSVMAGEELLDISIDNNSTHTITTGAGNVPSGFTYPLITALATKNSSTGKPRVFVLNRDYSDDITINVDLKGFSPGTASLHRYENADLTANNELTENVSIVTESISIGSAFEITIPAHSLWRIDFQ